VLIVMSDVPDEMVPDAPQRIGAAGQFEHTIRDTIFQNDPPTVSDPTPEQQCMVCGESLGGMAIGHDAESGAVRYICFLCRVEVVAGDK
jgi:hypothetical protein